MVTNEAAVHDVLERYATPDKVEHIEEANASKNE